MASMSMKKSGASSESRHQRGQVRRRARAPARKALKSATPRPLHAVPKLEPRAALALRDQLRARLPRFRRQESWRYSRVHFSWRKPKGIDSKMRLQVRGWPPLVNIGYRGPKVARGLHPSRYRERLVRNLHDLKAVDPAAEAARFAHALGGRARAQLLAVAKARGIRVLNPGRLPAPVEESA